MSTRLIVKNLPASADEKRLRTHFGSQGAVTDVRVLRKKDGSSRGFAFIGFKTEEHAECARKYFDRSCLGACKLSVEIAEMFKPSPRVPHDAPHKIRVQTKPDQRKSNDRDAPDGRSAKLAEFLGLMKPQSQSQTFANEAGPAISQLDYIEDARDESHELLEGNAEGAASEHLPANFDPLVADDDISDLEYLKSRMRASATSGAAPRSTENDAPEGQPPRPPEEKVDTSNQDSVTIIRSTGRLFVRNLAYTAIDDEIRKLMEEHGNLTECRVLRSKVGNSKGIAFVRFSSPIDAVSAFEALDGTIFQGRLLHLLPGKLSKFDTAVDQAEPVQNGTYKAARARERKENAGDQIPWSTFYMRDDTIAEAVADMLGISKAELLDPEASDAAVRMALGETQVLAATKEDLASAGVNVGVLEAAAQQSRHSSNGHTTARSKTVLLLKNLPFEATEDGIYELFEHGGGCARMVLPRTRALALVELPDEQTARSAFKRLAYKRFQNVPLYLEFAPEGIFEKPAPPRQPTAQGQESAAARPHEDGGALGYAEPGQTQASSTLFIKGLSFGTAQASLERRCTQAAEAVGGLLKSVKMPMKSNGQGKTLMQGYAFAEFSDHSTAKSVMTRLSGCKIDGHALVVELSHTGLKDSGRTSKKRERQGMSDSKIMVRNLAFEATSKDVRQLMEAFGHVKTCRLPKKFDGSTRGFAFVEFATKGESQKAMNCAHGAHLYGRRLLLEYAKGEEGVDELRSKVAKGHMAHD